MKLTQIDPSIEKSLVQSLNELKRTRNQLKVNDALDRLRKAANSKSENMMPYILQAVKEYVTLGEICDVLREVFGEYKPPTIF